MLASNLKHSTKFKSKIPQKYPLMAPKDVIFDLKGPFLF